MASTAGPDSSHPALAGEDPQLLFGVAQDLAWRHHNLPRSEHASPEQSHPCRVSYSLVNSDGQPIARIPLGQLQQGLLQRRRDLRRLLRRGGISVQPSRAAWYDAQQLSKSIKKLPHASIALAWAISTGQPYPRTPELARLLPLGLLLLLLGVIPGLVFFYLLWRRWNRYQEELERLLKRWRAAGSADPSTDFLIRCIARSGTESHS